MGKQPWLDAARKDFGIKEFPGAANQPRVLEMFREAGHPEIKQDVVPWCAAGVASWCNRGGVWHPTKPGMQYGVATKMSLWALAWNQYGQKCNGPVFGAIGVKGRKGGGHVGIVVAANATRVWMLGANQKDQVCVSSFPRDDFVGFRYPPGYAIKAAPSLPVAYSGAAFKNAKES